MFISVCLTLFKKKKTCRTIFQSSCKILPSPQQYGSSSYSAFSPALGIVIFIFSRCNRCVVESHCGFNLHFLMTNAVEHLSMCSLSGWKICSNPFKWHDQRYALGRLSWQQSTVLLLKCWIRTSSTCISWELIRNAEPWPHPSRISRWFVCMLNTETTLGGEKEQRG